MFEADIFASLLASTTSCIDKLVADVERSAAPGLKDRAKVQSEKCLESARVALDQTVQTVKETLNTEQKEVSRSLAPHVRNQLLDGYDAAMDERGKGSVKRQKDSFHSYISNCKDDIFEDGADVILGRLDDAAEAIGQTLSVALENLAQKARCTSFICCWHVLIFAQVEVNLAVLWEGVRDDPAQVKARSEVVTEVDEILSQLSLFATAENARHNHGEDITMG